MHHPIDKITHTTAFVTPVVEHGLEREICSMSVTQSYHNKYIYNFGCLLFIAVFLNALCVNCEAYVSVYLYVLHCGYTPRRMYTAHTQIIESVDSTIEGKT